MVNIGDCFLLQPTFCGSTEKDEKKIKGTVTEIYYKGMFALVDFGGFRECFPLIELEVAPRARRN